MLNLHNDVDLKSMQQKWGLKDLHLTGPVLTLVA